MLNNIRVSQLQAIMAGNFLNLGLLMCFLGTGNKVGAFLILASWGFAYIAAFVDYSDEGGYVRWLPWLLSWACLLCSGAAIVILLVITF